MPSSSTYGKLIKKLFVAPKGFIYAGADFNALEDRILAEETRDPAKMKIITDGLDGHAYNSLVYGMAGIEHLSELFNEIDNELLGGYYREKIDDVWEYSRQPSVAPNAAEEITKDDFLHGLVDKVKSEFSEARGNSKRVTFG